MLEVCLRLIEGNVQKFKTRGSNVQSRDASKRQTGAQRVIVRDSRVALLTANFAAGERTPYPFLGRVFLISHSTELETFTHRPLPTPFNHSGPDFSHKFNMPAEEQRKYANVNKAAKSPVQLKGSIDIVIEFLNYGINSILYQRGLYPSDSFIQREKYGLPLLVTTNVELKKYLDIVLSQMKKFLETKNVHKIVIVILRTDTKEPVERWQFDVELERGNSTTNVGAESNPHQSHDEPLIKIQEPIDDKKILKEIQEGIRGVIRQITASVTFLPTLEGSHGFDVLLYTDKDVELPNSEWSDTNARLITNGQHVQLRGFTTNIHKVEPIVSYVSRD